MVVCTFAGHRELFSPTIIQNVRLLMGTILEKDDEIIFYNGGMGEFDDLCAKVVNEVKRENPQKQISHILALPYMMRQINDRKQYYEATFDHIIVLELPNGTHYKRAIQARNRWMVDQSDWVIAYIRRSFGGAYETVSYAQKCGKVVVNTYK